MRPPLRERFPAPSVMGVVNVTPDSFSDGGVNLRPEDAVATARRFAAEGAAIVDVGGESTRPGAEGVSADEELRRVEPVLEAVAGELPISIDTSKAAVARRALELGVEMVNDVTALRGDPGLAGVVAEGGAYLCLMHMLGSRGRCRTDPRYDDVAAEVAAFLEERLEFAVDAGRAGGADLPRPGHRLRQDGGAELRARPPPRCPARARPAGRDRVLPQELARPRPRRPGRRRTGPLSASLAAAVAAYERGATILRVHDVRETVEALAVAGGRSADALTTIELVGLELARLSRRQRGRAARRAAVRLRRLARGPRTERARATASRTPIDYREVAALVREVSDGRQFQLLEALAATLAEASCSPAFPVDAARVRVGKPQVRLDPPVEPPPSPSTRRRS